jgi:WD40 repeat protein
MLKYDIDYVEYIQAAYTLHKLTRTYTHCYNYRVHTCTLQVKLYKYPCVSKTAAAKVYSGHSSHVTRVAFSHGGSYLYSTGGNDRALLQWQLKAK